MTRFFSFLLFAAVILVPTAKAEGVAAQPDGLTRGEKVFWLNAAELGVLTAWGIYAWQYGEREPHVRWEAAFGEQTKHGGSDKVCHAFTGYLVGRTFADVYADWGYERGEAALMGAGSSLLFTTMVEVGDSFSDYGLAPEDLAANVTGAAVGYLFARYPRIGEFIDWRLEYWPENSRLPADPLTDYSHMKHHVVLKLSGFKGIEANPLSFGEVHAGYYTRGFQGRHKTRERHYFLGIGVNLAKFLEPRWTSNIFNYYQIPATYIATEGELGETRR